MGKRLSRDCQGVVYAEFIMAFTPIFVAFLGIVQLAFLGAGSLVVQSAAARAARAAVVVLDDDPIFYDNEPRGLLDFNGDAEDDGWMSGMSEQLAGDDGLGADWFRSGTNCSRDSNGQVQDCEEWSRTTQLGQFRQRGGPRLRAIRRAAYFPLTVLSPELRTVLSWLPMVSWVDPESPEGRYSLRRTAIGTSPSVRLATGFLLYNPLAAAVNFPVSPQSDELHNDFTSRERGDGGNRGSSGRGSDGGQSDRQVNLRPDGRAAVEEITVRVTYLYNCAVPIANLLVCDSLLGMTGIEDAIDDFGGIASDLPNMDAQDLMNLGNTIEGAWNDAQGRYEAFRRNWDELQNGAEYPAFQYALFAARGAYFYVLRREATLPIQWAPYRYPTEIHPQDES